MKSYSESYKKAGVDVTAGYKAVSYRWIWWFIRIGCNQYQEASFGFWNRWRWHEIEDCFFNG